LILVVDSTISLFVYVQYETFWFYILLCKKMLFYALQKEIQVTIRAITWTIMIGLLFRCMGLSSLCVIVKVNFKPPYQLTTCPIKRI
jgi:hypothetical protein